MVTKLREKLLENYVTLSCVMCILIYSFSPFISIVFLFIGCTYKYPVCCITCDQCHLIILIFWYFHTDQEIYYTVNATLNNAFKVCVCVSVSVSVCLCVSLCIPVSVSVCLCVSLCELTLPVFIHLDWWYTLTFIIQTYSMPYRGLVNLPLNKSGKSTVLWMFIVGDFMPQNGSCIVLYILAFEKCTS